MFHLLVVITLSTFLSGERAAVTTDTADVGYCSTVKLVTELTVASTIETPLSVFIDLGRDAWAVYSVADRSQVSLIYSPACSPSRIITASSTTHFVLLVVGCLPSTIVDISPER